MLNSKNLDISKSRLDSSWRAISQSPAKSNETIFQPQQRKFTRVELLCDWEEDGVKPLSGAGQECGNQCNTDQHFGADWRGSWPFTFWLVDHRQYLKLNGGWYWDIVTLYLTRGTMLYHRMHWVTLKHPGERHIPTYHQLHLISRSFLLLNNKYFKLLDSSF